MAHTSLFRSSKTRSSRSQEQMKSQLLPNKQQYEPLYNDRSLYLNSYNIPLPSSSIVLLKNVISALTGEEAVIGVENRDVHVIGAWVGGLDSMVRCCFIQPELTSAVCSVPLNTYARYEMAKNIVCDSIPGATPCTVKSATKVVQISGRLAPYVVDEVGVINCWTFANIAKSKILFVCTDNNGSHILTLSSKSMQMVKEYMPLGSVCVYDVKTSGYKITVSPKGSGDMRAANKNTCMIVYGDGAFKFLGIPSDMSAVATSFRKAITSIMSSMQHSMFITSLSILPPSK